MTCIREHELRNGKLWQTTSDGPCVMVPISAIEGMSPEDIGETAVALFDEAKATDLLGWLYGLSWRASELVPLKDGEDQKQKFIQVCIRLAWYDSDFPDSVGSIRTRFKKLGVLRHLDQDLETGHNELCKLFDGAYNYLRTKKAKITPGQERARQAIIDMRNGCPVCGLLAGNHTEICVEVQRHFRRELGSSNEASAKRSKPPDS